MNIEKPTVIILGVDSPIGLTLIRELGQHGVPVHGVGQGSDSIGRASRYCRSFSMRPRESDIAQWLPRLIADTNAKALFAISEGDLTKLAALKPEIMGCRILTPRAAQLDEVLDKQRTLAIARELGIDVPLTWCPAANEDFAAKATEMTYPVVLKWADPGKIQRKLSALGIALKKSEYASGPQQLLAILGRYAPLGAWPMVQQYCPGSGLGQMLYMHKGRAALAFQHRRLHEWPPEGGVSSCCLSEPLPAHADQRRLSELLLARIGWEGPAMVEYRYDAAARRYWLMEVNGRFWGSLPLTWHCGVHFAWEAYRREILGQNNEVQPEISALRARYMLPEMKRMLRVIFKRNLIEDPFFRTHPVRDTVDFVASFINPKTRYFVFSLRDPFPFFSDLGSMVRKSVHLGRQRLGI